MTTQRIVVGAHYGLKDWLVQRVSAVVIAVYSLILFVAWVSADKLDFAGWSAIFASPFMKVCTLVAMLALVWHAWIGVRDIYMDYIKPTWIRLSLQVGTVILLIAYAVWAVTILWRL